MDPIALVTFLSVDPVEILFVPVWALLGGLCGLTLVNPERAFRYLNLFQLRDAELSTFGIVYHVGGALITLAIAFPYVLIRGEPIGVLSAVTLYGAAVAVLVRNWPPAY